MRCLQRRQSWHHNNHNCHHFSVDLSWRVDRWWFSDPLCKHLHVINVSTFSCSQSERLLFYSRMLVYRCFRFNRGLEHVLSAGRFMSQLTVTPLFWLMRDNNRRTARWKQVITLGKHSLTQRIHAICLAGPHHVGPRADSFHLSHRKAPRIIREVFNEPDLRL